MKTLRIASHEFRYMFWSIQTLVAFVLLFGFAVLFTADGTSFQLTVGGGNILINAPTMITFFQLMVSVVALFFVPSYMASSVLKDSDSKFDAILFSAPITKSNYLFGRFFGAFAALMLVMAAGPIGMLLGTFWPWAVPETLGPTNISHYLVSYFGFIVPTMMFVSAVVFAVAVMKRSMMYCYITALGIFVLYVVGIGSSTISPLWDPFMLQAFDAQTNYWTAAEHNTNFLSYTGVILTNRLIWLAVAISFFITAYLRFSFREPAKLPKISKDNKKEIEAKIKAQRNVGFLGTANWGRGAHFRQFWHSTKFEVAAILKSQPFILLMGFTLFLLMVTFTDRSFRYDVNELPVTRILISKMIEALTWALLAVVVFYGADVVWRDRENKFNEFVDATPVPNWVFVISKILALIVVIYSIFILGLVAALGVQVISGYYTFEIGFYFQHIFLFSIAFIFLAVLSIFLQVLVKSRFLGIALMGLYWAATIGSIGVLGIEHPLLRYAFGSMSAPLSDMNSASGFMEPIVWYKAYHASIAGLLVMLTYVLWNRGTLQPLKYRLKKLKAFKTPAYIVPLAVLSILFIGSGSFVYYNTNILNEYRTRADSLDLQIAYEEQFRQYENLPMPRVVEVKMDVDIFPYEGRIENRGMHILENKTDEDIKTIHMVFPTRLKAVPYVELEGASLTSVNDIYHYYIFELDTPMVPGEQRKLEFETLIHNQGFTHRGPDIMVVRNGTHIDNRRMAPHIGFNPALMVSDRNTRRDAGLEPLPRLPSLEDTDSHNNTYIRQDSDYINFETTVSTVANQTVISPGYLVKNWVEGDRRYFTYKMDTPIMNFYTYLSAEYEVMRDKWRGVDIEILYHAQHDYNIEHIIAGVKDSLSYFSEAFSPYQYRQLRIVEFPAYRTFARAFQGTIAFSENIGFVSDTRDPHEINLPYYVTAHEVAHQWWAHQVMGANAQGGTMLMETMAQYSALLVMEQKYGKDQIRKFLKFELDTYLNERSHDAEGELPLYRVEDQPYVHYRKGAVIMYALKDYIGEEAVNRALARLVENHAYKSDPYAISTDLIGYLKEEAGPEHLTLIEDFFEKITLYDLKLTDAQVEEIEGDRFKVTLGVEVAKFYADAVGVETEAPFDIPVDIGLFLQSPDQRGYGADDVIMLEKVHVSDGKSTIVIIVDKRPVVAGIDPYNKLIDRDSDDNLREVDEEVIASP